MDRQSIKYGIDRCPATKNYSSADFCKNCDFKGAAGKECCECSFRKLNIRQDNHQHKYH